MTIKAILRINIKQAFTIPPDPSSLPAVVTHANALMPVNSAPIAVPAATLSLAPIAVPVAMLSLAPNVRVMNQTATFRARHSGL